MQSQANFSHSLQASIRIVLAVFIILLLGALFLYKQRMLFADPCFIVFNILNEHSLVIQEHRYGSFITQLVPLIGGFIHLPLNIILLLYSASFNVFYLVVALILIYRFRQYELAILMAFYFTLFVSAGYNWPNNEVHQGIAWMFLFLGWIMSAGQGKVNIMHHMVAIGVLFLAIFSHFLVILPLTFLWLYFLMEGQHWKPGRKLTISYSIAIVIIFLVKLFLGSRGWYDGEKLQGIANISIPNIISALSDSHAQRFGTLLLYFYWTSILILATGIIFLSRIKKFGLLFLTLIFTLLYFLLVIITFPDITKSYLFYVESQWMALGIIIATPFVFHFLPQLKSRYIAGLLSFIFLVRIFYIIFGMSQFNSRLEELELTLSKMEEKGVTKMIFHQDPHTRRAFHLDWGLPVESLTLSAIRGDKPLRTFKVMAKEEIRAVSEDTFISSFRFMNYKELNPGYYMIDTTEAYQVSDFDRFIVK